MSTRDSAPSGAPCWADLWTADVEASRRFYGELFGWQAQDPAPQFGGYFMWNRNGVPIAGGMGDMGDMKANNSWSIYLQTNDIAKTLELAEEKGAHIIQGAMAIEDIGSQAVMVDPTGANLGAWQPGTFPGFTELGENGTPSWFELHTRDYATAVDFYRTVFGWDTAQVSDSDEFRYTVMRDPSGEGELAGIMDAAAFLPEGVPSKWWVYWEADDLDALVEKAKSLGGSVVQAAEDTPYGRLATLSDPAGAQFKLRQRPS